LWGCDLRLVRPWPHIRGGVSFVRHRHLERLHANGAAIPLVPGRVRPHQGRSNCNTLWHGYQVQRAWRPTEGLARLRRAARPDESPMDWSPIPRELRQGPGSSTLPWISTGSCSSWEIGREFNAIAPPPPDFLIRLQFAMCPSGHEEAVFLGKWAVNGKLPKGVRRAGAHARGWNFRCTSRSRLPLTCV
jgi:hypothetical protein